MTTLPAASPGAAEPEPAGTANDGTSSTHTLCTSRECDGALEANVTMWLTRHPDGDWTLDGVGDEAATFACQNGHLGDPPDEVVEAMSRFLEDLLPGTTWDGSDPNRGRP